MSQNKSSRKPITVVKVFVDDRPESGYFKSGKVGSSDGKLFRWKERGGKYKVSPICSNYNPTPIDIKKIEIAVEKKLKKYRNLKYPKFNAKGNGNLPEFLRPYDLNGDGDLGAAKAAYKLANERYDDEIDLASVKRPMTFNDIQEYGVAILVILFAVCFLLVLIASMFDDGVDFGKGFEKATPDKMIIVPTNRGYRPAPVFDLND